MRAFPPRSRFAKTLAALKACHVASESECDRMCQIVEHMRARVRQGARRRPAGDAHCDRPPPHHEARRGPAAAMMTRRPSGGLAAHGGRPKWRRATASWTPVTERARAEEIGRRELTPGSLHVDRFASYMVAHRHEERTCCSRRDAVSKEDLPDRIQHEGGAAYDRKACEDRDKDRARALRGIHRALSHIHYPAVEQLLLDYHLSLPGLSVTEASFAAKSTISWADIGSPT